MERSHFLTNNNLLQITMDIFFVVFLSLFLGLVLVLLFHISFLQKYARDAKGKILPGPPAKFIFGNMSEIMVKVLT